MAEALKTIELQTRPNPSHSVIWLHGLGADGNDFVPIVPELPLPPLGIRFIFPHAPMRPVTINGGFVMRAWYDIYGQDLVRREDERGIRESQDLVEALIAKEGGRGIPPNRIVLAGFSQGGVITLQTGLRQPKPLAGLMALSCYLPLAATVDKERNAASQGVPVFMAHGSADDIVPMARGAAARDKLTALGYDVEWHQYPMPHSVHPDEVADIGAFLTRVLL
ncbi:MAG TPA: alpha/beta hydrolase [Burkholderiales bacterium]|nr:alpha/beta hydrolase [Burkholderiales bacterium]